MCQLKIWIACIIVLILNTSIWADPKVKPTQTPVEVLYFQIDTSTVVNAKMTFTGSGVSYTASGCSDGTLTYIVIEIQGTTMNAKTAYDKLEKNIPTVKKLKKVKDKNKDDRSTDADYKFVVKGGKKP